jgi:hypothetical protein
MNTFNAVRTSNLEYCAQICCYYFIMFFYFQFYARLP